MSAGSLLSNLWLATWMGSLAIFIVLLLRAPVRQRFGAGVAYALWSLPLAAWLVLWLPARVVETPTAATVLPAVAPATLATTLTNASPVFDAGPWWLAAWCLGIGVMIAMLLRQQHRFERALGAMRAWQGERGIWQAEGGEGLPAVVGLLRPRIIVPADIDSRFDREQRGLMLAHERIHMRRGDAWANALAALVRSVFWFNPLVHVAASRMRHDQELACDARVIALYPHARRAYGEAMLKNLHSYPLAPLGCQWGLTHPIKERIMLLKHAMPTRRTRVAGALLVAAVAIAVAAAAWAAMPPRHVRSNEVVVRSEGRDFQADFGIAIDGGEAKDILVVGRYDEPFSVRIKDSETGEFELRGTVTPASADGQPAYRIRTQLQRDGKPIGNPEMLVAANQPGRIMTGNKTADGGFTGLDMRLRVGEVDAAALQARHQAEEARHQSERTMRVAHAAHAAAAADAEKAAAAARKAAEHATRIPGAEAREAAKQARIAAGQAAEAARLAAGDATQAAEAAALADRARIERNVIIRKGAPPLPPPPPTAPRAHAAPLPPPPPKAPRVVAPLPPAPPKAPRVPSAEVAPSPPKPLAPPIPPNPTVPSAYMKIRGHDATVAAGGRALTSAEAGAQGLESKYRWVDIEFLSKDKKAGPVELVGDVVVVDNDTQTPRYVGYLH